LGGLRTASQEFVAFALELGVKERVLEANGISVAPSVEAVSVDEGGRLHGAQSAFGDLFAFDIEASCDALE
jgi:hypothetical protein